MSDEDTIKHLRERVAALTRANELLQARLDELRMVHQPGRRIFPETPAITNWSAWDARMRRQLDLPATTTANAIDDGPGF